ncbi:GNAT family N-acetyltransferase [Shewanella kaireitica]|uniref:GNAT family N-acetyltransferase n=1 Tax=Shewanella kaireitica TaxID=212021 RepID=UPI002010019A|nr:GNAT family protein [Shewanella kaireitica]MCL1093449.1 GNAT family N-acetyltransferase [Shewanella kaireitica]
MFTLEVTAQLKLALVEHSFSSKYYAIVTEERDYLSRWLAWPPHANSETFFTQFITKVLHEYADNKSLVCAMIFNGELVGNVSLNTINHSQKKAEIGYWLSSHQQGKGIVTQAVNRLIELAFTDLRLERVEIMAATENIASRSVAERLGFKLERIITKADNLNGRLYDHAVYGLERKASKPKNNLLY